ncbi:MAG: hypothetical protein LBG62_06875 [Candidatus Methanoplasma sp.]|jgi:hypothetical protein|nr:hypothetical protein [Candidatus Methanoplasma sp.]
MRFTTIRLCGGKALMAVPAEELDLDLARVADALEKGGVAVKKRDEMMVVAEWGGAEATIYSQGKIMFFPMKDKAACVRNALEILETVK